MLKIVNKGDTRAEMYITGDIVDDANGAFLASWDVDSGYMFPAKVRAELDSVAGKDLTIYINSDGGSVPAGVAIASMIKRHDGHTKAVVDGWCCSIATQIFFAAKERAMPENAYLMIHKPWVSVAGDAEELRKTASVLDTLQDGIESTYRAAARDGVTADAIHEMVNAETWLTGREASEYFHVDVLESSQMVAKHGKRWLASAKMPKGLAPQQEDDTVYPPEVKPVENHSSEDESQKDNFKEQAAIAVAIAKGAIA